jgi:hypothetical protein
MPPYRSSSRTSPQVTDHSLKRKYPTGSRDDDYRSVIDDLTLEIQQLKKELKRYKASGPAMLQGDKLFEIKVHGLPQEKRIELQATLRDLAINFDTSPDASSSQKKERITPTNHDHIYSISGLQHKRAPSSPGLNLWETDSAHACVPIDNKSSITPLCLPTLISTKSFKGKVKDYLRDIPDGLYPQHLIMTDEERKGLVVNRLEQLFTGRINGTDMAKKQPVRPGGSFVIALVVAGAQVADLSIAREPPTYEAESVRETRIHPPEQRAHSRANKCHSRGRKSTSDPNKNHIETRCDNDCLSSDTEPSPSISPQPEQRPTRPCELDPDRAQIPSENMNYLRHLGLLPPKLLPEQQSVQDGYLNTEGWVYLNLLYNLAQLHMISVTRNFVRSVVSEISTKLQLSPDGHKIRWRSGSRDTEFSSYNSQKGLFADTTDDSENKRRHEENKRRHEETRRSISNVFQSGSFSKNMAKANPQLHARVKRFRYKPLFTQQKSSGGSLDMTVYPSVIVGDNPDVSDWDFNNSAGKPQHRQGTVTYYSGASFCTDLSGDPVDMPPTTRTLLSGNCRKDCQQLSDFTWSPRPTTSGSFSSYKPLTDRCQDLRQQPSAMDEDSTQVQGLTRSNSEQISEIELNLAWGNDKQYIEQQPLVPSGLGGVFPDDRFVVVVDTARPKQDILPRTSEAQIGRSNHSTVGIIHLQAKTSISGLAPNSTKTKSALKLPPIEIEYLSCRIKRLTPLPLPTPAIFFPPFSTDSSTSGEDNDTSIDVENAEGRMGRRRDSCYFDNFPFSVDISSGADACQVAEESSHD